ncbi:hypothetical protein MRS76_20535 [Rhizobiaceae bacterium n13]|uniref:hypothetical protein n=1 Tax=Ferirhizobium litorale TaxID=2927786 RepID=UPI0024B2C4D8|nr:hypothetical protein [Fererhizobium litorale]MDI7864330.1 hypothetical protein [Fererhizobium litorale]
MQGSLSTAFLTALVVVEAILIANLTFRLAHAERRISLRYRVAIEYAIALGNIGGRRASRFLAAWKEGHNRAAERECPGWGEFRARRERELQDEEAML